MDDCESSPNIERVWPKDAHRVILVEAYDCLDPRTGNTSSVLISIKEKLLEIHTLFYEGLRKMVIDIRDKKDWLDDAIGRLLGHREETYKSCPRIADLIAQVGVRRQMR